MKDNVTAISNHQRLIVRWKQGDTQVAQVLYDTHRDQAFRLALSLLDHQEDAEDVAQEALSHALLNPQRFDPAKGRFGTWLGGIVVRMCRSRRRAKRRRERLMFWTWGRSRSLTPSAETPEEATARNQQHSQLWRAVQALPELHKEAVILRMWGGHTYQDIAQILQCPQRTAQSRVRLGLERLRLTLGQDFKPEVRRSEDLG